jgi:hypothetical protein
MINLLLAAAPPTSDATASSGIANTFGVGRRRTGQARWRRS